jgi:hypothetical protein
MKLSDGSVVKYSKNERRLFEALSGRRTSTLDLVGAIYGRRERPYHARQVILGTMSVLSSKIVANREPFAIQRTKRCGPHPIEFWIE